MLKKLPRQSHHLWQARKQKFLRKKGEQQPEEVTVFDSKGRMLSPI